MTIITTTQNGYTFETDSETGTTTARGTLQDVPAPRDAAAQRAAGGEARQAGDQGGHLVAARFNGPSTPENLYAQSASLNQGAFKTMENAEARLLEQGATIETERTAFMSGSERPSAFLVNDTITYADGRTAEVNLSFANLPQSEMEAIDGELSRFDIPDDPNPGDSLRETFSPEEYAELMENTDAEMPGIREMFEDPVYTSLPDSPAAGEGLNSSTEGVNSLDDDSISSSDDAGGISAGDDSGGIGADDGGLDD